MVTLNPGQYGNMTINAGAKVTLLAGTYNFLSLNVQPDVILTDNAATSVNVAGALTWSDRVKVQSTLAHPLTLYTNATNIRVGTDGIFKGFLIAPERDLDVASRTSFQGCVGAHDITFEPDVTLTSGGATLPARPRCRSSGAAVGGPGLRKQGPPPSAPRLSWRKRAVARFSVHRDMKRDGIRWIWTIPCSGTLNDSSNTAGPEVDGGRLVRAGRGGLRF